ncbi:hypothetical protein RvY_16355 [Ramazzottius varieornatus]|uniref:Amino acid permease/ SLC12A domain-containing protein n=1 Tax=Ramazzottius varieornatus TaxID=947166 RepID=A0A1D1VZF7_RAMVA|nr:hypothetical protein RvY_16355 [Ramazzottius varieornatus]
MEGDKKTAIPYSSLRFHADTMPSIRRYPVTKRRTGREIFDMETYGAKRHSLALVEDGNVNLNGEFRPEDPKQRAAVLTINNAFVGPLPQPSRMVSGTRRRSTVVMDSPAEITRRASVLQQEGRDNEAFNDDETYDKESDRDDDDNVPDLPTLLLSPRKISAVKGSRKISVGYDPTEVVPSKLNYEAHADDHHVRPTLEDLRVEKQPTEDNVVRNTGNESKLKRGNLGWIRGVVLWSILNLWGVMLFLRMSWMNAQAGMGLFLLIVLLGTVIALLTSLSTSAISTNGEVGVGGTYYMISRSLGPQFGAAIGVIFSLANAISVALNIQGFADVIRGLLAEHNLRMVDSLNDIRIIGIITLVALTGFTFFGMEIAAKLQIVFFVIISASILNIIIGSIIPPSVADQAKGFVGYSNALFVENFYPAFQKDQFGENSFMSVFGVFFPSVTGILAGTSITGDLRDPSGAIPKGTICAILFTTISYIVVGWCSAAVTLRHASGDVQDLWMGNLTACQSGNPSVYDASTACKQGSVNNMEIVEVVGHFRPLILAGIFSSTLSTALGCINFAPKIFQALCRDNIFPFIHIFGKGYGKTDEPYRAYGLVMIIAVVFLIPCKTSPCCSASYKTVKHCCRS